VREAVSSPRAGPAGPGILSHGAVTIKSLVLTMEPPAVVILIFTGD